MSEAAKPSLAQLQSWMRWLITEPDGAQVAIEEPDERFEKEPKPSCLMAIAETPGFSRLERLDVYAEGYYLRIVGSLGEDYKAVLRWMGEDDFRSLISDYLLEYPSKNAELLEVGRHLPAYLKSWLDPGESPFLPDLARLEWARAYAYFAENMRPWDRERLSAKSPEQLALLRLETAPATDLFVSGWQVGDLRARLRAEAWTEDSPKVPPKKEKQFFAVYREALWPKIDCVLEPEFRLLECAKAGMTLEETCGRVADFPNVTPELLFEWLAKWASRNAICCR